MATAIEEAHQAVLAAESDEDEDEDEAQGSAAIPDDEIKLSQGSDDGALDINSQIPNQFYEDDTQIRWSPIMDDLQIPPDPIMDAGFDPNKFDVE